MTILYLNQATDFAEIYCSRLPTTDVVSKAHIDITKMGLGCCYGSNCFDIRIDAPERDGLRSLSEVEGRPINQLLIEAIRTYLGWRGRRERTLEANLRILREYRRKDPGFQRAITAFIESEASQKDPLEGEPVESNTEHPSQPIGELQNKLREVIGG